MPQILLAEQINKSFDGTRVLQDVSISLNEGEIVSILGISGSGKTTLFNILSGLYTPDSGKVYLKGEDITEKPGNVSYMLQKDLLFPYKKVIDNVCLPLTLHGTKKKEARAIAEPLFKEFGIDGTQYKYPAMLSGGMRQRAAFLRTYLASKNGVALLDEPFSALDAITKSQLHSWYLDVMQNIKLSTVFITHDIDEAIFLSDRIYILSGNPGKVKAEIVVGGSKPRSDEFLLSEKFCEIKKEILDQLK